VTAPDLRQQLQSALGPTFTLTRELGGGGMARVFVARDTTLERDVVVKVLSPELAAGVNVERFAREIRLAAGLQQANIVPLLSAGTSADGLPYYTMPFVEGESLRHRLAAGPLAVGEAVHVLRDVARALAYAHGRGIVHRDIKPDNVLRSAGTAVVTDFGIAKALGAARTLTDAARGDGASGGALTAFGHAIGTPAYMAPEQIAADPAADHRVDVYALGCLAYELLAGRPPFAGVPPTQLLAAHLSRPAEPVTVHRPEVPPALAALVARCLEKDPARRPATAAEVLVALDAAGTPGEGVAAPATGLARVLAGYGAAAAAVLALAWAARAAIGLPDWVLPATALLLLAGLLAVLAIAGTQRAARGAGVAVPTRTPGGTSVPCRHDGDARHARPARRAVRLVAPRAAASPSPCSPRSSPWSPGGWGCAPWASAPRARSSPPARCAPRTACSSPTSPRRPATARSRRSSPRRCARRWGSRARCGWWVPTRWPPPSARCVVRPARASKGRWRARWRSASARRCCSAGAWRAWGAGTW
jgi:serine/threonine-protein kinase